MVFDGYLRLSGVKICLFSFIIRTSQSIAVLKLVLDTFQFVVKLHLKLSRL